MSYAARLAKLEEARTDDADGGPLLVRYGCTADTNPPPRPPVLGDAELCVTSAVDLPAWAEGRAKVFIPAETGPNDWPEGAGE